MFTRLLMGNYPLKGPGVGGGSRYRLQGVVCATLLVGKTHRSKSIRMERRGGGGGGGGRKKCFVTGPRRCDSPFLSFFLRLFPPLFADPTAGSKGEGLHLSHPYTSTLIRLLSSGFKSLTTLTLCSQYIFKKICPPIYGLLL